MDDTDFEVLVSEDIKNKVDQKLMDYLRLEENRDRWRHSLCRILSAVNENIRLLEEDAAALRASYSDFTIDPAASIEAKLEKSKRFRFHAEKRLAEIDRMTALGQDDDPSLSLATFLRDAIKAHRQWHVDNGLVNSEGDDLLYAALDGVWGF